MDTESTGSDRGSLDGGEPLEEGPARPDDEVRAERQRANPAPTETKPEDDRRLAERAVAWAKSNALIAAVGVIITVISIVVAIVIAIITIQHAAPSQHAIPVGVAVNTVPHDPISGAAVYPVPGGNPSDYLSAGVSLRIDCLQRVRPDYLFARISDGQFTNHWIDVFDIKTPRDQDVRFLKPPLRQCGPPVTPP